jgi:hypothetical protein
MRFTSHRKPFKGTIFCHRYSGYTSQGSWVGLLERVNAAQQEERHRQEQEPRGRGRRRQTTARKERVNYTSPEHAGEPHRGTISDAEKQYVREHLEEVNTRLAANDQREIDPNDPQMAARYGFSPADL